jgi:glycosyltransferase involved in cell wall biosynthesis
MGRDAPTISVIVNCRNGEKYLRAALDSIFAQTHDDWEVVFLDNQSSDNSAAIAKGYDSRLRYIRSERFLSLGAARNAAVEHARGQYLAFLDTDDIWLPEALRRLEEAIGTDFALCYSGVIAIDAAGRELRQISPRNRSGDLLAHLLRQFDIYLQSAIVRRSALARADLSFDPAVTASEEYCLFMQLAASERFRSFRGVVAKYRIHDDALTNKSIDRWADEREYTLQKIVERHPGVESRYPGAFAEARARARYYRARFHLSQGRHAAASQELRQAAFVSPRYAALFALSLLPAVCWKTMHRLRTNRSSQS